MVPNCAGARWGDRQVAVTPHGTGAVGSSLASGFLQMAQGRSPAASHQVQNCVKLVLRVRGFESSLCIFAQWTEENFTVMSYIWKAGIWGRICSTPEHCHQTPVLRAPPSPDATQELLWLVPPLSIIFPGFTGIPGSMAKEKQRGVGVGRG